MQKELVFIAVSGRPLRTTDCFQLYQRATAIAAHRLVGSGALACALYDSRRITLYRRSLGSLY